MPTGVPPGHAYWNDWSEKLRTIVNSVVGGLQWSAIIGTPTTLGGYGITDAAKRAGVVNIVVDDATKGFVLKDTAGHYWRINVSTLGVLSTTDLGTTLP